MFSNQQLNQAVAEKNMPADHEIVVYFDSLILKVVPYNTLTQVTRSFHFTIICLFWMRGTFEWISPNAKCSSKVLIIFISYIKTYIILNIYIISFKKLCIMYSSITFSLFSGILCVEQSEKSYELHVQQIRNHPIDSLYPNT
jgi:hypothetical protein